MSTPCLGLGHLFFPDQSASGNGHLVLLAQAQQICSTCPLAQRCLDGALRRSEPCGIWGGEYIENGRIMPLPRPKGRPRKLVAA